MFHIKYICLRVKSPEGKGRNRRVPNHCSKVSLFWREHQHILEFWPIAKSHESWTVQVDRSCLDWLRKILQEPIGTPQGPGGENYDIPMQKTQDNLSRKSHWTNLHSTFCQATFLSDLSQPRGPYCQKNLSFPSISSATFEEQLPGQRGGSPVDQQVASRHGLPSIKHWLYWLDMFHL